MTDPAELARWFSAQVELELKPGAGIRFRMPDEDEPSTTGEVLEVDPPRVFAFRWDTDVLRIELEPDGAGIRLTFVHELGGGAIGRLGAGRNAAGWHTCLAVLSAHLDGRKPPAPKSPLPPHGALPRAVRADPRRRRGDTGRLPRPLRPGPRLAPRGQSVGAAHRR